MSDAVLLQGDCLEVLKELPDNSLDSLVTDPPAGISFMGKAWDDDKGGRKQWITWMTGVMSECLRVLKPGAHGLIWAIPRTSHWTATALEDAGFEVRDVITHLFGQGFPKSLDVSKAIDKAAGAEREILRKGFTSSKEQGGTYSKGINAGFQERQLTAPATDSAKQWQGFGTALKPASEHWILVRKPCDQKTVAANVLEWGTGAINIDASRIAAGDDHAKNCNRKGVKSHWDNSEGGTEVIASPLGRFPANLILTEGEATEALDAQSGQLKTGASRFFYCAKISSSERNAGLDDMPDREGGVKNSSGRGYSERDPHKKIVTKNPHPTVKPKKLMSYLIRMITPPGGVVLDPFMGSGSTGIAAKECGFDFIGIEKESEYFQIAEQRINSSKETA